MAVLNPYIHFRTETREALAFYASVFGGEATSSTFGEAGMPGVGADENDLIMHGQLTTPAGFTLMMSDTPKVMDFTPGTTITISVSGAEADELRGYWDRLVEGGQINQPLVQAPWGDFFGQVTDKFGIEWMFDILPGEVPAQA